jgi:hypothetical protein
MSVLECEILFFRAINIYCQYLQATVQVAKKTKNEWRYKNKTAILLTKHNINKQVSWYIYIYIYEDKKTYRYQITMEDCKIVTGSM